MALKLETRIKKLMAKREKILEELGFIEYSLEQLEAPFIKSSFVLRQDVLNGLNDRAAKGERARPQPDIQQIFTEDVYGN